ncbi:MAG: phosphoribosylamine--glycine ligase [Deltaproteobacteria bacterium]|jgi:phosphoribosylamine--glycine ligase|nr:phosphoribosylamine--glycine ligase [Deltaproteobacteria bacterium]
MKILLIGSGGREHALAWKLKQNPRVSLCSAPGSPALEALGEIRPEAVDNLQGLKDLALEIKPDLVVVGPELPLVLGISDVLREAGFPVFGPSKLAARIEGSKVFAKDFMIRHNLPTANYAVFYDAQEAQNYLKDAAYPVVLKADGLAAGKGVVIAGKHASALNSLNSLTATEAGKRIIVEEYLAGEEISFFGITDGKTILPLPSAQDHKTIYDGDRGPNTGGMGAYSPAPLVTPKLQKLILETILEPAIQGLAVEGVPFCGLLYAGLMITLSGPKLLEFNARFGDPETQALMPLLESDLAEIFLAAATGNLHSQKLEWSQKSCACVVMSASGYPGPYRQNDEITGLDKASSREGVVVFEAGVGRKNGVPVTKGGRVLGVTALGKNLKEAVDLAYEACGDIQFKGAYYRKDIGQKAFRQSLLYQDQDEKGL